MSIGVGEFLCGDFGGGTGIRCCGYRTVVSLIYHFLLYALSGPILTIRSVNRLELKHVVGDTDEDCDDDIEQNDETRAKKQQKEDETSKSE